MLGLANAALVVYRKATGALHADAETLNRVARMIAMRVRVFTCAGAACSDPRPLSAEETYVGEFEGGGTRIRFADGRAAITNLCVRFEDLPALTEAMTSVFKSGPREQ
jgi:hypothetical protein